MTAIVPNPAEAVIDRSPDEWFECITQSPDEPSPAEFLAVCTVSADLLAESVNCTEAGCGGHPICRPCYELAVERGRVRS